MKIEDCRSNDDLVGGFIWVTFYHRNGMIAPDDNISRECNPLEWHFTVFFGIIAASIPYISHLLYWLYDDCIRRL